MNKKLLVVIIILIALTSFGYFTWVAYEPLPETTDITPTATEMDTTTPETDEGALDTETADETPAATVTEVSYTADGFIPKDITIKAGDSVRFANNSASLMWVASDNHPTHELYSEFDQKTAVPNGGVYTFKFDKVGTWTYHNHVESSNTGTITVTE